MMVKDMSGLGWHGRKLTKFVSCLLSWENMNAKCTIYYTQTQGTHEIFNFIVHKPDQIFKKKTLNIFWPLNHRERGQWTVYYTSPQSFMITLFYSLALQFLRL